MLDPGPAGRRTNGPPDVIRKVPLVKRLREVIVSAYGIGTVLTVEAARIAIVVGGNGFVPPRVHGGQGQPHRWRQEALRLSVPVPIRPSPSRTKLPEGRAGVAEDGCDRVA